MAFLYAFENKITESTICCTSSEDALYIMENVCNRRPSLPFRFAGVGSIGNPEWICFEFGSDGLITLAAIFNHNLTALTGANDLLQLKGCLGGCDGTFICNWAAPDFPLELKARLVADFNNLFRRLSQNYPFWRIDVIDESNPDGFIELGEIYLGEYHKFSKDVHLQPGRADGPSFYMSNQRTAYGQDWTAYLSESEHFSLTFKNINDPNVRDEFHSFLSAIQATGGKFIVIPDHRRPFCYYVMIENLDNYSERLIYGERELRQWRLELKTLTKGIALL